MKKTFLIISIVFCFIITGCSNDYDLGTLESMDEETIEESKTTAYFLGDIQYMDNDSIIKSLQEKDINVITIPIAWCEVEKTENQFNFQVYEDILDKYVSNGFEFIFILDSSGRTMVDGDDKVVLNENGNRKTSIPSYIYEKYPDDMMIDFYEGKLNVLDFVEGTHTIDIQRFYDETLTFLKNKYEKSIRAISPGIMNEFELKFPQSNYKWASYSEKNKVQFINFLDSKYSSLENLNEKLNTNYISFDEIVLPIIDYNNSIENSSIIDGPLFVDFMEFRETQLVNYVRPFSAKIKQYGFNTIGYFAQFYHPQDAIYATHVIEKSTDLYDKIVVDFNFYDGYKEVYDDMVPAFLTNYAKNLGYNEVFTGIYVERIAYNKNIEFLQNCLDNISNDGNSNGIEVGNVRPITNLKNMSLEYYKKSKLTENHKIGMYFSKWNTYKTHGEAEKNIGYFTDSFTNMMDVVQNKLGYSVDVISDTKVLDDISAYDLIIIPAQIIVSTDTQKAISNYVNNGGNVLIDYRYAEFNEFGEETSYHDSEILKNIYALQAVNEEKTLNINDSNDVGDIRIQKNENNLPNYYLMAVNEGNELFTDKESVNIGYKDDNLIYFGFQPQNIYAETNDTLYIKLIDYYIKELLQ